MAVLAKEAPSSFKIPKRSERRASMRDMGRIGITEIIILGAILAIVAVPVIVIIYFLAFRKRKDQP